MSSGSRCTTAPTGATSSASWSIRGVPVSSCSITDRTGTPASSAPFAPSPSSGAAQTSAFAPESVRTYSISSALSSACTGTPRIDQLALEVAPVGAVVQREPEDTAIILYTSGTTGKPKGAEITHLNVTMNVVSSAAHSFDITKDDVVLGCLPFFHTFGQTCCMNTAFYVGASVVMLPRFDGAQALQLLEKERCTIFMAVPTMYIGLLEAARTSQSRPKL